MSKRQRVTERQERRRRKQGLDPSGRHINKYADNHKRGQREIERLHRPKSTATLSKAPDDSPRTYNSILIYDPVADKFLLAGVHLPEKVFEKRSHRIVDYKFAQISRNGHGDSLEVTGALEGENIFVSRFYQLGRDFQPELRRSCERNTCI